MMWSLVMLASIISAEAVRLPALQAEISGDAFARAESGAEGGEADHVRMGSEGEGALTWRPRMEVAGRYRIGLEVATPYGTKGYRLEINGVAYRGFFRGKGGFTERAVTLVELPAGESVITLRRGWGSYDVRALEIEPAAGPYPAPLAVPEKLTDPQATREAQALYDKMREGYGRVTLSGQYRTFGQRDFAEADYVERTTGRWPLIYGADLMPFSPSFAEKEAPPWALVDDMIAAGRAGHVVALMWHWTVPVPAGAPYYKGFNTQPGGFDAAKAAKPGTPEQARLLTDLDAIAPVLKRLADAGIPVLWRPLHEPENGAFWWGSAGPEAYRALWRLTRERLEKYHGLHNLIWVYSPAEMVDLDWYPGDDVVDMVAPDLYPDDPRDPLTDGWQVCSEYFAGRKLLGLGEVGGVPDLPQQQALGVRWGFFLSWTEKLGPSGVKPEFLREVYGDTHTLTWKAAASR
ncbi:glycosyl hydrolase [soil metagenome]